MEDKKTAFLAELTKLYGPSLERYLSRKLDNPADAAEVTQETFIRLYRRAHPEELDQLRRRTLHYRFLRAETREIGDGELPESGVDTASPEQILSGREKLDRIYAAIDELPEKCRQAFLLHRSSGLSYNDIAQELGVSVSSVEKYILEALKHCRQALSSYYEEGTEQKSQND